MARLVPITSRPRRRKFGAMKGKARVTGAFFEPLPDEELDAWEDRGPPARAARLPARAP